MKMNRKYLFIDALQTYENLNPGYKLPVFLGIDENGKEHFADLVDLKHILITGQTGSGKTTFGNSIIASMLYFLNPYGVKLFLVDMKRVEFSIYEGLPHLLTEPLIEVKDVLAQLELLVKEQEARLGRLKQKGIENIENYHSQYPQENFPYIIVLVDTFSDIICSEPERFEDLISKLTESSVKVGIHLVMWDSRPSVDIYTPIILSSFPTKICFATSCISDSQVIINSPDGAKLLGSGDILLLREDQTYPIRLQAPFISDKAIEGIIDCIKNKKYKVQIHGTKVFNILKKAFIALIVLCLLIGLIYNLVAAFSKRSYCPEELCGRLYCEPFFGCEPGD